MMTYVKGFNETYENKHIAYETVRIKWHSYIFYY